LTDNVVQLPPPQGSWIATLELYRTPGGVIEARLIDMPTHVIDELPGGPSAKLAAVADWLPAANYSLRSQAACLRGVDADSPAA
jgi:hypothetical protein